MINYLQSITALGLRSGVQRAAMSQQKIQAIQTDDGQTYDVESVRALKKLEISTALHEKRLEERDLAPPKPRKEGGYTRSTESRPANGQRTFSNPRSTPFPRVGLLYPGAVDILI